MESMIKRKKFFLLFLILIMVSILNSCTTYYYVPGAQNIPFLKDEQMQVAGGVSINDFYVRAAELQTAYACSKYFLLTLDGQYIHDNFDLQESFDSYYLANAGFGVYNYFDETFFAEILTGAGIGNLKIKTPGHVGSYNLVRLYVAPTFGINCEFFRLGISLRTSQLKFNRVLFGNDSYNFEFYKQEITTKEYYMFEPTMVLGVTSEKIGVQLQGQLCLPLNEFPGDVTYLNLNLSFIVKLNLKKSIN